MEQEQDFFSGIPPSGGFNHHRSEIIFIALLPLFSSCGSIDERIKLTSNGRNEKNAMVTMLIFL